MFRAERTVWRLFSAGAWLIYLKSSVKGATLKATGFLAGLVALLALCSRESACLWPLLFLIHLFVFQKHILKRQRFLTTGRMPCSWRLCRAPPSAARPVGPGAIVTLVGGQRVVLMTRALGDYGRLMLFPATCTWREASLAGSL